MSTTPNNDALAQPIETGVTAPDFTLSGTSGSVHLADFLDKENVVLFFIREYSCPPCQRSAVQLSKIADELKALDTSVFVVASGSPTDAAAYKQKLRLQIPVLVDSDREVYHQYGLHKGMLTLFYVQRSATVLVDKKGIVRYLNHSTNPDASFDANDLLAAVRQLEN